MSFHLEKTVCVRQICHVLVVKQQLSVSGPRIHHLRIGIDTKSPNEIAGSGFVTAIEICNHQNLSRLINFIRTMCYGKAPLLVGYYVKLRRYYAYGWPRSYTGTQDLRRSKMPYLSFQLQ